MHEQHTQVNLARQMWDTGYNRPTPDTGRPGQDKSIFPKFRKAVIIACECKVDVSAKSNLCYVEISLAQLPDGKQVCTHSLMFILINRY